MFADLVLLLQLALCFVCAAAALDSSAHGRPLYRQHERRISDTVTHGSTATTAGSAQRLATALSEDAVQLEARGPAAAGQSPSDTDSNFGVQHYSQVRGTNDMLGEIAGIETTGPSLLDESVESEKYHMVARRGGPGAQKRQADAAYVDGNQTISNDCRYAPVYQIQNGSLSIFVSNVQYYYTTNTGVDVQVFTPSLTRGNVTQSFRLASSGEVIWRNPLFDGSQAMFCSTDNGTIYAVFRTAARPEGCFTTRLMLFMASSCARLPEYVSTVVQTQVTTAVRIIVTTEPRDVTMTEREVSTYETTLLQTVTSTYETILPASTVTATYETTLPAPTATATSVIVATTTQIETSVQSASTVTTTFQTVQPASTFVTTAVITQSASTITTTFRTTQPAVTVTQSVTATTTAAAASLAAPSLCGNQGIEYAVFANNPTYENTGAANYNPEFMKARSAGGTWTTRYYNSTYDTIGGAGNFCPAGETAVGQIYGIQTTFNCREFSIDHRFYMFAYMSGTWRIEVTSIDDQVLTWVGAKAQTGWTKANADTNRWYGQITSWLWVNVTAGNYYPVRVTFGNYGGGASYFMGIYDPTNNVAFTTDTRSSPYILRRSCDGTTAPPFPYLFGEEL